MIMLIYPLLLAVLIYSLVRWRRSTFILVLAIGLWAALPLYNRWVLSDCRGDCGIRVDLIPIGIVLLVTSGFAIAEAIRRWRAR